MKQYIKHLIDTPHEVIILYLGFLLTSGFLFSVTEGVDFTKSLYWAFITATSTGYGDIAPKTYLGYLLAFLVTHMGVFFFAPLIIGYVVLNLLPNQDQFSHEEQEQIKQRLDAITRKLNDETN